MYAPTRAASGASAGSKPGLSKGGIAGIVIAIAVVIVLAVVLPIEIPKMKKSSGGHTSGSVTHSSLRHHSGSGSGSSGHHTTAPVTQQKAAVGNTGGQGGSPTLATAGLPIYNPTVNAAQAALAAERIAQGTALAALNPAGNVTSAGQIQADAAALAARAQAPIPSMYVTNSGEKVYAGKTGIRYHGFGDFPVYTEALRAMDPVGTAEAEAAADITKALGPAFFQTEAQAAEDRRKAVGLAMRNSMVTNPSLDDLLQDTTTFRVTNDQFMAAQRALRTYTTILPPPLDCTKGGRFDPDVRYVGPTPPANPIGYGNQITAAAENYAMQSQCGLVGNNYVEGY